jgi:uncharacterized protein (DUF2384 family)
VLHQPVFAHVIESLRDDGGLKGIDIANIADVSEATVSRWTKGTASPQPRTQLVLSDLNYIVNRLRDYYERDEIRVWLFARHPQLGGKRAIDLINAGESEQVLDVLERLDAGAFL